MCRSLLIAALLVCACQFSLAATYHVAQTQNASDESPGTEASPWLTISHAAQVMQPGDTVMIHPGTYREWVAPSASGTAEEPIRYVGTDRDSVILTGADILEGWQLDGADGCVYKYGPWKARFQVSRTADGKPIYHHPADERHKIIGRPEQVIVDGELLDMVLAREDMKPGTFFPDLDASLMYIWLADGSDPADHTVEACTRGWVFGGNPWSKRGMASHIHLSNVTIRYAGNHAQRGALWVSGDGWHLEHVTVEWTSGNGVRLGGRDLLVRDLISQHNGQMGMGGGPQGGFIEDVKLLDNNREGFNAGWEAGGMKFIAARDTVLSRVEAARNDGPGIWFDIDNRGCIIRQCVCYENTGHGIFVEISGGFIVTNNLCYNNGLDKAWASAGICIGESEDCLVEHNTCVGNPTGISVREQGPRTFKGRFRKLSYWVRNFVCQFNICAQNDLYQFGLWSDNPFFGPHPSANVGMNGTPLDPAEQSYRIDHNLYSAEEGQGLILWGCPWRNKHQKYESLVDFTAAQGHDAGSSVADPGFADVATKDFTLSADSPAVDTGAGAVFLQP